MKPSSLALVHVLTSLTGVTLAGCYDDCDRIGDVRCTGSKVQIFGHYSRKFPAWDEASDCAFFAAECSAAEPGHSPDSYCNFPDFVCDGTHDALCHGDAVVSCEESGASARLQLPCEYQCVENGDFSFCAAQPLVPIDAGASDAGR